MKAQNKIQLLIFLPKMKKAMRKVNIIQEGVHHEGLHKDVEMECLQWATTKKMLICRY